MVSPIMNIRFAYFRRFTLDLTGDAVTLFFYTFSRRPPSASYPYGYGKFESVGTVGLSTG